MLITLTLDGGTWHVPSSKPNREGLESVPAHRSKLTTGHWPACALKQANHWPASALTPSSAWPPLAEMFQILDTKYGASQNLRPTAPVNDDTRCAERHFNFHDVTRHQRDPPPSPIYAASTNRPGCMPLITMPHLHAKLLAAPCSEQGIPRRVEASQGPGHAAGVLPRQPLASSLTLEWGSATR
jgi:hypothetical protein